MVPSVEYSILYLSLLVPGVSYFILISTQPGANCGLTGVVNVWSSKDAVVTGGLGKPGSLPSVMTPEVSRLPSRMRASLTDAVFWSVKNCGLESKGAGWTVDPIGTGCA